jgi:hypothetical protein
VRTSPITAADGGRLMAEWLALPKDGPQAQA